MNEIDCRDLIMIEYEWAIFLSFLMLIVAMAFTADYMAVKYSQTTQEEEQK